MTKIGCFVYVSLTFTAFLRTSNPAPAPILSNIDALKDFTHFTDYKCQVVDEEEMLRTLRRLRDETQNGVESVLDLYKMAIPSTLKIPQLSLDYLVQEDKQGRHIFEIIARGLHRYHSCFKALASADLLSTGLTTAEAEKRKTIYNTNTLQQVKDKFIQLLITNEIHDSLSNGCPLVTDEAALGYSNASKLDQSFFHNLATFLDKHICDVCVIFKQCGNTENHCKFCESN